MSCGNSECAVKAGPFNSKSKLLRNSFWKACAFCVFAASLPSLSQNSNPDEIAKWRNRAPEIGKVLDKSGETCPGGRERVGIIAAGVFDGTEVALIDFCPGGAYTDWIVAMEMEATEPVQAVFRKNNARINLGFAQGASVMHGKDVKLVPEKKAIYDISWDNDGLDSSGTVKLRSCSVDAFVWRASSRSFDWNGGLTKSATRSYCDKLRRQVH